MPSASSIPQEELDEYREIFNLVDDDGSGEIGTGRNLNHSDPNHSLPSYSSLGVL